MANERTARHGSAWWAETDQFRPKEWDSNSPPSEEPTRPSLELSVVDPQVDAFRQHPFSWSATLLDRLETLSAAEGVPLSTTLIAGFETLLYRYTDEDEFTLRVLSEESTSSDLFANAVRFRSDFRGSPSFRGVLTRVRDAVPVGTQEGTIDEADDRHGFGAGRFFRAIFVATPNGLQRMQSSGLRHADLWIALWREGNRLAGCCAYRTRLFDQESIIRLIGHFETVLEGAARNPDQDTSLLPFLPEVEIEQLLVEWNDTECPYQETACIHELFEMQVQRSPDNIAAVFEDVELTYRELNARANQVAHELRALGAGPDTLIGLHVAGPLDQIVGLLGILKAGAAYVPLDPAFPKARLKAMLHDADVRLLVTQKHLLGAIPVEPAQRVLCLDGDWIAQSTSSRRNLERPTTPDALAYVLYTSGSTGTPKGIPVTHRSVVNFLQAMQRELRLTSSDRVLAVTTINFDMAVLEIYLPLTVGASVCVVDRNTVIDGAAMASRASNPSITLMQATPAMWQLLIEAGWTGNSGLKAISGGEPLLPELAAELHTRCASVWNMYGPTETTVYATVYKVDAASVARVPIGRPIGNTQLYVLDRHLQPRPVGIPGEIYIGGLGVAKGYLNRPEMTAKAFLPDVFRAFQGRLYKTGDYGCYRADGNVEYLGRIDHQVKIHGFRIELDEVEAALRQHPDVQNAIVSIREDFPGARRLVAYVVTRPATQPTATDVLGHLRVVLPYYMVPSACVFLKTLPLTPNGKVDRRGLPSPESMTPPVEQDYVAPQNDTELRLAVAWESVLGKRPIGTRDNFFDHGGDSLLAAKLVREVEKTCGRKLPLGALYQAPTIEDLARNLGREVGPMSLLIPIQPVGSRPPFFWFHGERSNVVLPRYLGEEQPLYGILHQGHDGRPARYTTVEGIADHYATEIRRVQPQGPYYLGGYCFGGILALETAQRLQRDGESVGLVALLDPDNLTRAQTGVENVSPSGQPTTREFYRDRLRSHLDLLKSMHLSEMFDYCRVRVASRVENIRLVRTGTGLLKTALCNICLGMGCRLPARLHSHYMLRIYAAAMARYVPERYSGRVLVWRSTDNACDTRTWKDVFDHVEIHEVSGNHRQILNEPHIATWAYRLASELRRLGSHVVNCGIGLVTSLSDWADCVSEFVL